MPNAVGVDRCLQFRFRVGIRRGGLRPGVRIPPFEGRSASRPLPAEKGGGCVNVPSEPRLSPQGGFRFERPHIRRVLLRGSVPSSPGQDGTCPPSRDSSGRGFRIRSERIPSASKPAAQSGVRRAPGPVQRARVSPSLLELPSSGLCLALRRACKASVSCGRMKEFVFSFDPPDTRSGSAASGEAPPFFLPLQLPPNQPKADNRRIAGRDVSRRI
jgi:hypothetical protein